MTSSMLLLCGIAKKKQGLQLYPWAIWIVAMSAMFMFVSPVSLPHLTAPISMQLKTAKDAMQ